MKSRCCTFYKNTSESTSLCKLDTDSSPSPPVPCRSCLPRQPSNPEHKWLSAQVGVSRPERGRRVESTFPLDSATFFHFPSWRSAPAQLLILFLSSSLAVNAFFFFFFCCYSLYPGNQRTVVCLPRLRFMSISLSPRSFSLPLHLCSSCTLTCKNSVPALETEELNQQAALSQEREGRENYLLLSPRGADRCCCVLALLHQHGALGI